MNNENITKVYLLSVPLENDFKHTLHFANITAQEQYFQSKAKEVYTNFTYQRKDNLIYVPDHFDNIYECNYVMYQNTKYNNKWFYAFIKNMKYEQDDCTILEIETDVMQTWMFDYTVKSSFVEREHVSDDAVGLHTVPENVELGELIVNEKIAGRSFTSWAIIVGATVDLGDDSFPDLLGTNMNNVYSGIGYYCFTSETELNSTLKKVAKASKSDSIVSIFMGANQFFKTETIEGKTFTRVKSVEGTPTATWSVASLGGTSITPISKPSKVDDYTPVNKKLLTFPYSYLMASNNNGANAIYKYERFSTDECDFQYIGTVCPGMSIRLQPLNYNNQAVNNEEGLNLGKLPVCAWTNDVYTNWLTSQSVNIACSIGSSLLTIAGGVAMAGSGAGALMGAQTALTGALGIAQSIGQVYQMSLTPPQAEGNVNCGDAQYSAGYSGISMYKMSIKSEYAKIIDEYFNMFGYKVNRVKVPNKAHRSRYWYTKTLDIDIDGKIPLKDMQKIKECYNNGITFWRNATEIGNYGLSNNITG